jgi:chromosome segregation and condensation protein ScpB
MDSQLLTYAGIAIGALVLYYMITQWVHQIHKRNRYLKAQIELLCKIAEKQGVEKEEIEAIVSIAEKRENPLALA